MKLSWKVVLLLALIGVVVLITIAMAVVRAGFRQLLAQTILNWSDHYQPSSMEEAQQLAPYEICVPSYLSTEFDSAPVIGYLDVWPDNRAELIFWYHKQGTTERFLEIRQRYWASEQPPDLSVASLKKPLVVWLVGWDRAEEILDEVTTKITQYESNGIEKWLVEIIKPFSLRGSVVEWTDGKITYQLYSALESAETVRIGDSICGDNQTSD